jgi:tetratricopeptide (TPR) repeat protein
VQRDKAAHRQLLAAAGLCVLTCAAFANSFSAGMPLDNRGLILQDERIRAAGAENIRQIVQHSYWWPIAGTGLYRPLTTLSYLLNYAILGNAGRPAGYHFVNLLLHLTNVLLVFALALKLIREFWLSVWLAGLWAIHPVLTESVTNIVGRADLLAGVAVLGGFLMYLKFAETSGFRRIAWFAGLLALTAIGVFSKESAVTIVAPIMLYESLWWRNRGRALLLGCIAVLAPIAAMLYFRWRALATDPAVDFPFTDNPLVLAGFWQSKLTALKVMAHYLGLALWPMRLSADYSYNQIPLATGTPRDWSCWLIVGAAIAAAAALLFYRRRVAFFWAAFALATFLPTSNLILPVGTIMAERFLYLPLIGVLACLVLGVYAVARRWHSPQLAPALLAVLLGGFTVRTWARNADWRDDLSLATAAVAACPDSFKTHQMLAETLYDVDRAQGDVHSALAEAQKAMAILKNVPDAYGTVQIYRFAAGCYLTLGDPTRAVATLERGKSILEATRLRQRAKLRAEGKPDRLLGVSFDDDLYRLLAAAYFAAGEGDKALQAALMSRRVDPGNPEVYSQLGQILFAAHRPAESATMLMEGVLLTSDMRLRQELVDVYRTALDPDRCAVIETSAGTAINPKCAVVRQTLCDAAPDMIRIRLQTRRPDLAAEVIATYPRRYGCLAGPLQEALQESPTAR